MRRRAQRVAGLRQQVERRQDPAEETSGPTGVRTLGALWTKFKAEYLPPEREAGRPFSPAELRAIGAALKKEPDPVIDAPWRRRTLRNMTKIELERALAELPTEEQIELIGRAWDNLAADPENLGPLTDADRELLDRRVADHEADPASAISIDDTIAEARRILHRR